MAHRNFAIRYMAATHRKNTKTQSTAKGANGVSVAVVILLAALEVPAAWPADDSKDSAKSVAQNSSRRQAAPELAELRSLKDQIEGMRAEYEKRIKELEARLEDLQAQMLRSLPEPSAAGPAPGQPVQTTPGALNPAISAIGNFVGRGDSRKVFNEEGARIDNKTNLREAEIDMRVPVDPYADGVLITSLESETPGRFSVDVEEAYVNIKKLPFLSGSPLGLKLKVGRFRPAFGNFNRLHTHDLPQTFRPLAVQEFLGEEGFVQNGLSGNFFIPTPWDEKSSLDFTLEFLNGGDIAISPELQGRRSYLGHLRWFRTFKDTHNLELGWSSYYHPSGNNVPSANLHGFDFIYRWKPLRLGEWKSFLVGGETLFTRSRLSAPPNGRPVGFTVFGQGQFNRRTYAGLRWDRTDSLLEPGAVRRSVTPYLSYYFSEFLRFRLNYEHRWSDLVTEDRRNSVFLELNWVFGSHPPEPFWVNK